MRAPLVLVVDDFVDGREMYAAYLENAGFRVAVAADGHEAIVSAKKLRPAVILMDLTMPRVDGWEATRRLKMDPETRHIHIVALTGRVDLASRERALLVGCDVFVAKPCLPSVVAALVVRLLDEAAKRSG